MLGGTTTIVGIGCVESRRPATLESNAFRTPSGPMCESPNAAGEGVRVLTADEEKRFHPVIGSSMGWGLTKTWTRSKIKSS